MNVSTYTNGIVIWNVDPSRNAAARKGQHIQGSKIGAEEPVFLKISTPGQKGQAALGCLDEEGELLTHRAVDHGDEAFPFSSGACVCMCVYICTCECIIIKG